MGNGKEALDKGKHVLRSEQTSTTRTTTVVLIRKLSMLIVAVDDDDSNVVTVALGLHVPKSFPSLKA